MIWSFRKSENKKNENFSASTWRNQSNTQAEPNFWFRLVRWAKFWSTQKIHWQNPIFGSARSASAGKLTEQELEGRDVFQIFRKTLKHKLRAMTD